MCTNVDIVYVCHPIVNRKQRTLIQLRMLFVALKRTRISDKKQKSFGYIFLYISWLALVCVCHFICGKAHLIFYRITLHFGLFW